MRVRNVHLILNDGQADSRLMREAGTIADLLNEGEGVEILAAARGTGGVTQPADRVRLRQLTLIPGRGRAARFKTAVRLILWYLKVLRHALPHGRIVFNVHHAELLPLALLIRFLTGSAILYVPHELEAERAGQRASKSRAIVRIERFAWPRLAGAAVVNESIADEYLQRYGGPRPNVIENVQASAVFNGQAQDLHALTGLAVDRKICIYVGALVPSRGLEPLLEWFASREQNDFALICMGRGEMADAIRTAAAGSDNIRLLPPVPAREVPSYVAGADVSAVLIEAVSKSYSLSLPNKFFESIAGGARVVASPLVELRRFIETYDVGCCIAGNDAAAFFAACHTALTIPQQTFDAGRQRLFAEHGWPVQREKIQSLYRKAGEKIGKI